MSITINNQTFPTKTSLASKLRNILHATKLGENVTPEQQTLLTNVFTHHPDWSEKCLGQDPVAIRVDLPTVSYNRCFFIVRHDGSIIDISFHKAINGIPAAKKKTKQQRADEFVERMKHATRDAESMG